MRVLLTGGGTAGHINPAVAIAKYIQSVEKDSEFLFVGTERGLEKTLVPKEGFQIEFVKVMGLKRKLTLENLKVFQQFLSSQKEAERIIDKFKPDVVVATGGYVCTPAVYAAKKKNIPVIIHEQNVVPGLAIKMLAKKADVTAVSFEKTEKFIDAKRCVVTGNPVRPNLFDGGGKMAVRNKYGFDMRPVVVLFGGSLGAERMNDALCEMLEKDFNSFNLIAATGERHYESIVKRLDEKKILWREKNNLALVPYIYDMSTALNGADLAVCRAGAITISELNALGKASVLIPSPNVAHDHQRANAEYLADNGAAEVLYEDKLSGESLKKTVKELLSNSSKLKSMREASEKMGNRDACEMIYGIIKELTMKNQ